MSEYRIDYIKTPDRDQPFNHYTYQYLRELNLPEARKKAMNMIRRGSVAHVDDTYMKGRLPGASHFVEFLKNTPQRDSDKFVGILIKTPSGFYWKAYYSGGYHKVRSDGTIESRETDIGLPKRRTAYNRRS